MKTIQLRVGKILACALMCLSLTAHSLDKPGATVILTITGQVKQTNMDGTAAFDMPMLEKLPQKSLTTQTPWYDKPTRFTGPLLRDVLAAAGAQGNTLVFSAIDGYTNEVPFNDATKYEVIVARLRDDKPMTVRDKGPLFVIYPYDKYPELKTELYYSRSVWQLRKIVVK